MLTVLSARHPLQVVKARLALDTVHVIALKWFTAGQQAIGIKSPEDQTVDIVDTPPLLLLQPCYRIGSIGSTLEPSSCGIAASVSTAARFVMGPDATVRADRVQPFVPRNVAPIIHDYSCWPARSMMAPSLSAITRSVCEATRTSYCLLATCRSATLG